jgi:hypothetical protein
MTSLRGVKPMILPHKDAVWQHGNYNSRTDNTGTGELKKP